MVVVHQESLHELALPDSRVAQQNDLRPGVRGSRNAAGKRCRCIGLRALRSAGSIPSAASSAACTSMASFTMSAVAIMLNARAMGPWKGRQRYTASPSHPDMWGRRGNCAIRGYEGVGAAQRARIGGLVVNSQMFVNGRAALAVRCARLRGSHYGHPRHDGFDIQHAVDVSASLERSRGQPGPGKVSAVSGSPAPRSAKARCRAIGGTKGGVQPV